MTKSYLQLVDFRGLSFIDRHLSSASVKLEDISIPNNEFIIQVLETDLPKPPIPLPIVDRNRPTPYWVQRGHFVKLLSNSLPESVSTFYGSKVSKVEYVSSKDSYEVSFSSSSDDLSFLHENDLDKVEANLIVAADGKNR